MRRNLEGEMVGGALPVAGIGGDGNVKGGQIVRVGEGNFGYFSAIELGNVCLRKEEMDERTNGCKMRACFGARTSGAAQPRLENQRAFLPGAAAFSERVIASKPQASEEQTHLFESEFPPVCAFCRRSRSLRSC